MGNFYVTMGFITNSRSSMTQETSRSPSDDGKHPGRNIEKHVKKTWFPQENHPQMGSCSTFFLILCTFNLRAPWQKNDGTHRPPSTRPPASQRSRFRQPFSAGPQGNFAPRSVGRLDHNAKDWFEKSTGNTYNHRYLTGNIHGFLQIFAETH